MHFNKVNCAVFLAFVLLLMFFPCAAGAEEECLSPADKKVFMEMYADVVERGHIQRVEEVKQFLRTHGCAKEMDEAERQAQEIVKGMTK
jgi:hypothetical protein